MTAHVEMRVSRKVQHTGRNGVVKPESGPQLGKPDCCAAVSARSANREFRDVVSGTDPRRRIARFSTDWKRVLTKADAASLYA